jgi:hypothetical protein
MGRRRKGEPPRYRLHKQSGQAVVSLPVGNGTYKDCLRHLGPYDTTGPYYDTWGPTTPPWGPTPYDTTGPYYDTLPSRAGQKKLPTPDAHRQDGRYSCSGTFPS